jgi:hypothetical protein
VVTSLKPFAHALVIAAASLTAVHAQTKPADPPAAAPIPLKVQVVISRFENDKKISSMPYTMSITAGQNGTIRMGTRVPVMSTSYTPIATGGASVNPLTSYQYQDVGTNIDCSTSIVDDGKFRLTLTLDDSSVYPEDQGRGATAERPAFRSFRANNSVVLKDGQTSQFTTAVDKMTGIVTKVDVTVTVIK